MKKILVLIGLLALLSGCYDGIDQNGQKISAYYGRNLSPPDGVMKKESNFEYILTCIEGVQFIAYQTTHGLWEITSTGKECGKNEL